MVQRYYVQYLSGYDAIALDQSIQNLNQIPEEDAVLLSSICQTISTLTVDQVEDPDSNFDFSGLRLDWARLQVKNLLGYHLLIRRSCSYKKLLSYCFTEVFKT